MSKLPQDSDQTRLRVLALESLSAHKGDPSAAFNSVYNAVWRDRSGLHQALIGESKTKIEVQRYLHELVPVPPSKKKDAPARPATDFSGKSKKKSKGPVSQGPSKKQREAAVRTRHAVAESILDTFIVNGKPIGDNTAEEALKAFDNKETQIKADVAWVRLGRSICSGVPPQGKIRDYVDPQEAAKRERISAEGK